MLWPKAQTRAASITLAPFRSQCRAALGLTGSHHGQSQLLKKQLDVFRGRFCYRQSRTN